VFNAFYGRTAVVKGTRRRSRGLGEEGLVVLLGLDERLLELVGDCEKVSMSPR
jgi:hypothetical protein